jgi:hypothetical protein
MLLDIPRDNAVATVQFDIFSPGPMLWELGENSRLSTQIDNMP